MHAFKEKVRKKVDTFIEALEQAHIDLSGDNLTNQQIEGAVQTLSRVRNTGPAKQNQGLILLDQYFAVPQIGEVIRDLLVLQSLSKTISKHQLDEHLKTRKSKESLHTQTEMIPEEDQSILDVLKMTDPSLV